MRKIISFMMIFPVLLCCLAVPAEAAELTNDNLINVLDYGYADMGYSNVLTGDSAGTHDFFYLLPSEVSINYVDMVLYGVGSNMDSFTCMLDGEDYVSLDMISIGNGFVRVYGTCEASVSTSILEFSMEMNTSYNVEVVSLYVGNVYVNHIQDKVGISLLRGSTLIDRTWYPNDDPVDVSFTGANFNDSYIVSLWPMNWERYDYFDMVFYLNVFEVNSITCTAGDIMVPFEYQFIQTGGFNTDVIQVVIRLDLRGLDRTGEDPYVNIHGVCNEGSNSLIFFSGTGIVATDYTDADVFWLQQLYQDCTAFFYNLINKLDVYFGNLQASLNFHFENLKFWLKSGFQSVVDAINPETDADDKVAEDVGEKTDQLDEVGSALESVEKPEVGDMNFGVEDYVSGTNITMATMGLSSVMASEYIGSIFMMSIILAFAGFVLYGKR